MISLRMKTLLKIYLTKWFYLGLEWYEIDLVIQLLDYNLGLDCDLITPSTLKKIGISVLLKVYEEDEKKPLNLKGWDLIEIGNLADFIYPEEIYHQVWKLRSVQSLRDFIFQPLNQNEHEGKKGIKKPRIRGYRDGKASAKDPTLTALSRQVDVLFYTKAHEERLNDFWNEVETLTRT
jgi:hypothetical protein